MTTTKSLNHIQKLQFSDKPAAESMLLDFLKQNQDPNIEKVELLPKPESLNSVNGYLTYSDQTRLFFKSHTEEGEELEDYYNGSLLSKAGYPVMSSKRVNTKPGQQIALYEIIKLPTLFDLVKEEEDRLLKGKTVTTARLVESQKNLDRQTFKIYESSLEKISAPEHAKAPVHQLFIHRLKRGGRVDSFYFGKSLHLGEETVPFERLAAMRWIINGVTFGESLADLIDRSEKLVLPQAGASIIGHGDAHNGNVFVDEDMKLFLFDPAFAGRHHPLIDLTKPLFHNVFARWMYHPQEVSNEFQLNWKMADGTIEVTHNFEASSIRQAFLASKIQFVIKPTLELLRSNGMLPQDWQLMLRSTLFCCPFLTVNLLAEHVPNGTLAERYTLPVKLLGLATAVELGARPISGANKIQEAVATIFE